MSGHNKWSKIKRKKGAEDIKKSQLFSMLVKTLTLESRKVGGDKNHPNLKNAIERAKSFNMPNDNIERAIQKGKGQDDINLEEVVYEAYGPGGIAIIMEGITDNKNRTTAEIKHLLTKVGGSLGTQGSVLWAFTKIGQNWQANNLIPLTDGDNELISSLIDDLENHEDIKHVYTNAQIK